MPDARAQRRRLAGRASPAAAVPDARARRRATRCRRWRPWDDRMPTEGWIGRILPAMTRVFSGIQPTGAKHLGNYIGAIRHYVADQDLGEAIYCIVDLHSISRALRRRTTLRENTLDTAATLLAAGLDPARCTAVRAEPRARAHRGRWLLGARRDVRRAAADDAVQGEERGPGVGVGRPLHLPGAAGGGHPALPGRPRPGRRRPAPASRAGPRHRPAVQPPLRRDFAAAGGGDPRHGRPRHGPPGARRARCRPPAARRRAPCC